MSLKAKIIIAFCIFFLILFLAGGWHFGSEQSARNQATAMFNQFTNKLRLPRDIFDGPKLRGESNRGYSYEWRLKANEQKYPPVQIVAIVHGSFNSDIGPTTEALLFFQERCRQDKINQKNNSSAFSGFCN